MGIEQLDNMRTVGLVAALLLASVSAKPNQDKLFEKFSGEDDVLQSSELRDLYLHLLDGDDHDGKITLNEFKRSWEDHFGKSSRMEYFFDQLDIAEPHKVIDDKDETFIFILFDGNKDNFVTKAEFDEKWAEFFG